jgi:hypothetical protein
MRRISLACALAGILGVPAFGQGVDPLIGTWKLSVEKSTASFPLPKSATNVYSREEQNIINNIDMVTAQGQSVKSVLQHIYDGMPHPSTASDYDSSAYTRIGNTINLVRFRQGKTVEVGQGVIVPGKTLTFHEEGISASGQPYHYIYIYDRQ